MPPETATCIHTDGTADGETTSGIAAYLPAMSKSGVGAGGRGCWGYKVKLADDEGLGFEEAAKLGWWWGLVVGRGLVGPRPGGWGWW